MATSRRFIRCPHCNFEHLMFEKERVGKDLRISVPWSCPLCRWHGDLLPDRTLTQKPPA
jgi:hypothetical protein